MFVCVCRGAAAAGDSEQHSEGGHDPSQTGAPAAAQRSGFIRYVRLISSQAVGAHELFIKMKYYILSPSVFCVVRLYFELERLVDHELFFVVSDSEFRVFGVFELLVGQKK